MRELAGHPLVGNVRGVGLIAALEFMAEPETRTPFDPRLKVSIRVMDALRRRGVLLRALGDALACSPPLIINADDVQILVASLKAALDEVHAWVREQA